MNRGQAFISFLAKATIFAFSVTTYAENLDPTNLTIEEIMDIPVRSSTRTDQKFSDTAAAAYVITQNDIQRSGVTNIPDVLRMAPGVQVARISASEWAVTARGFNGRFANKLLVLVDGRTVYSPTFGGVRWENLDLVLEDIDQIEVIRGPGASVWGHNAVNGVINIITKHTEDTQRGLVSVTAGDEEQAIVEFRYGNRLGDNAHYRVFGKFLERDESIDLQGNNANDDWSQGRGGFRMDWNSQNGDRLMLTGDGYVGDFNEITLLPDNNQLNTAIVQNSEKNAGASIFARWEHDISIASKTHAQFYYEYFNETDPEFVSERSHTFDVDIQHDIALARDNDFNWGLGYRYVSNTLPSGSFVSATPTHQDLHLISAFVQDKAVFFDDSVHLTFGTKVQYYTLSGWDYQPSVRLLWKLHPEHRLWASFSRATRSPSRGETALSLKPLPIPGLSPLKFVFQNNTEFDKEQIHSYELGYRGWFGNRFSFDLAFFYSEYKDLFVLSVGQLDMAKGQIPISNTNGASAKTWGIESAVDWRPIDPLRLQISYNFLRVNFRNNISPQEESVRSDPEHQVSFRSSFDISSTVTFDLWVRYVGSTQSLSTFFSPMRSVDSYVGLDLRLAWKPIKNLELSVAGQNLNNSSQLEYVEELFANPRQIERSIYGKIQWHFDL